MQTDSDKKHLVHQLVFVSSILSVVGCSFVIFSFLCFRNLRMFPFKLIFFLSLVELVISVSNVALKDDGAQCKVKGALGDYFELASMMWNLVIAFNIWQILYRRNSNVQSFEKAYHVVAWGVPFALWLPVLLMKQFGQAGIWCWITSDHEPTRLAFFYAPWAVSLVLTLGMYLHIGAFLLRSSHREKSGAPVSELGSHSLTPAQERQVILRLSMYILVYLFVSIFPFANRINEYLHQDDRDTITTMALLHGAIRPLLGFLNSLVYGVNRRLINEYKSLFVRRLSLQGADSAYRSMASDTA